MVTHSTCLTTTHLHNILGNASHHKLIYFFSCSWSAYWLIKMNMINVYHFGLYRYIVDILTKSEYATYLWYTFIFIPIHTCIEISWLTIWQFSDYNKMRISSHCVLCLLYSIIRYTALSYFRNRFITLYFFKIDIKCIYL